MTNPFDIILSELAEIKQTIKSVPGVQQVQQPEIINTEELCKRLDISEPTAIKWRRKKKIPFFTIGTAIRYNWPEVVKFLEAKK